MSLTFCMADQSELSSIDKKRQENKLWITSIFYLSVCYMPLTVHILSAVIEFGFIVYHGLDLFYYCHIVVCFIALSCKVSSSAFKGTYK